MKQSSNSSQERGLKIIAAIPAYNEGQFIGEVISKVKRYVDEVIVVDDGSTDNTAQVAETGGAQVVRCCQSAKWDTFRTEDFVMVRWH